MDCLGSYCYVFVYIYVCYVIPLFSHFAPDSIHGLMDAIGIIYIFQPFYKYLVRTWQCISVPPVAIHSATAFCLHHIYSLLFIIGTLN